MRVSELRCVCKMGANIWGGIFCLCVYLDYGGQMLFEGFLLLAHFHQFGLFILLLFKLLQFVQLPQDGRIVEQFRDAGAL